jgi:hypothetical protein
MFIGHFAVGFAAKRVMPAVSLGTLLLAALLADLVWPVLVLTGIEQVVVVPGATVVTPLRFIHYPYSHSLLAMAGWAVLFGAGYALARRAPAVTALLLAVTVLSHWLLDVVSHAPDVPVTITGSTHLGLGLWNSLAGTAAVEITMFAAGLWLYVRSTQATDRKGQLLLIALCAFLLVLYLGNLLGPPPPSGQAVAGAGLATWVLIAWGYLIDRHRRQRLPAV